MIQIEESNPSFESCSDCIYSDDSEEICIFRRCIHVVAQLKECYVPKQRKKGEWIKHVDDLFPAESTLECSVCHHQQPLTIDDKYCPNCGAEMGEQDA